MIVAAAEASVATWFSVSGPETTAAGSAATGLEGESSGGCLDAETARAYSRLTISTTLTSLSTADLSVFFFWPMARGP